MPRIRIASLQAVFGADDSQLTSVAKRATGTIDGFVRGADGRLRDAKGRFVATGKAAQEMGDGIKRGSATGASGLNVLNGVLGKLKMFLATLGVVEAIKQIVEFGNKTADVASDVNEAITKNQQLFGAHAAAIEEWSNTTSKALGISRKAALQATGDYGNLFRGMGFGEDKAARFSKNLVTIASDLASFNNKPVEQALDAIRSGLVGEQEPLRAFGVNLNETVMKAEALRMGLGAVTGTLSPQQKVLSAISLLYKQTSLAQGDFARTANGAANQGRTLAGRLVDLEERIGRLTLTIKTKAQVALLGLFDAIDKVNWDSLGKNAAAAAKQIGDAFVKSDFAQFFIAQWNKIVKFFEDNGPLIQKAMQKVLDTIVDLWNRYGGFIWSAVLVVWDAIKKTIAYVLDTVLARIKLFWQILTGDWAGAMKTINTMIDQTVAFVGDLLLAALKLIGWFGRMAIRYLADTYTKISSWVVDLFADLGNRIGMQLGIALTNAFGKVAEPVARQIWQFSQWIGKAAGTATANTIMPWGAGMKALDNALPNVAAPEMPKPPNWKYTAPKIAVPKITIPGADGMLEGIVPNDLIAGTDKGAEKSAKTLASFMENLRQATLKLHLIKKGWSEGLADFYTSNPGISEARIRQLYGIQQELEARSEIAKKSTEKIKEAKRLQAEIADISSEIKTGKQTDANVKALDGDNGNGIWERLKKGQEKVLAFTKSLAELRQQVKEAELEFLKGGPISEVDKLDIARKNKYSTTGQLTEGEFQKLRAETERLATVTNLNEANKAATQQIEEYRKAIAAAVDSDKKVTASGQLLADLIGGKWKNVGLIQIEQMKKYAAEVDNSVAAQLRSKEATEASADAAQMLGEVNARLAEMRTGRADTEESFDVLVKRFQGMGFNAIFAAAGILKVRQQIKELTEQQKKQARAEQDARAVASMVGRSVRGIWEDLLSGNTGLLKRFVRRITDAITEGIGVAIERAITRSLSEKLTKALMDGVGPALKKLMDGIKESAGAVDASAQALLSGAFSILSVLNRKKKSGFGSILGGLVGAFVPGGGLLSALAGYNIGNALDNGDVMGAVLGGVNFNAQAGIGQQSPTTLGSGVLARGRATHFTQNLYNFAPINGLSGVEQISGVMGRSAERKIAFVGG